jgi:hypothetical protein
MGDDYGRRAADVQPHVIDDTPRQRLRRYVQMPGCNVFGDASGNCSRFVRP